MSRGAESYLKTVALTAGAGVLFVGMTIAVASFQTGLVTGLLEALGGALGLLSACIAAGGVLVIYRSRYLDSGRPDLFLRLNAARSLETVSTGVFDVGMSTRRLLRFALRGSWLLVGDVVDVRSLEEIEQTLDESGCLDGLPFMAEMAAFCGRRVRVFRCVDKIYDYGRSKTLRRLTDVVLLAALRCDGSAHGGCQASCYLMWNRRWLRTIPGTRGLAAVGGPEAEPYPPPLAVPPSANSAVTRYTCQYTQVVAATVPLRSWDLRQDLRPLMTGNVTVLAFCVALLTRLFNAAQTLRGGSGFPAMSRGTLRKTPLVTHGLVPGHRVRVLRREQIAATLDDTGRNRGLWFDSDMIKHCGGRHTVAKRVDRIIDDATGQMLEMKTPCIVLRGVDASGELLRFCSQHEHIFWREGWLAPEASGPPQRSGSPGVSGTVAVSSR
jgi:hypothetical protein